MAILSNVLDLISYVLSYFVSVQVFSILFFAFMLFLMISGILRMVYR